MTADRIEVAAAVITRDDGRFLLAQRPAGKVYAGYWEFPGGKIECGESPLGALQRELHEELGIEVEDAYPWITRDYDYQHAAVRLRFFRVAHWHGEPQGREGQSFAWQSARDIAVSPLLPANRPVLRALELPTVYGITHAAAIGVAEFSSRLENALKSGLRLIQIREKMFGRNELRGFSVQAIAAAHRHGARVLINTDAALASDLGADGVHFTSAQLGELDTRPLLNLVGASCHDATELERAILIGADFVVLGPVLPTASHPGQPGMGWERFADLIQDYPLPVYALGGLRLRDLARAWQAGAHGIAMMRGAWERDR
ncbi:MAG: Nudix family hydrolase [Betaproteobacteria bacterium]|nr:Nudix family hydrolase [Betaproteobacteria bacterium]